MKQLGLDIGSTTLKYVLLDEQNQLFSCKYQRHGAKIGEKLDEILCQFETDYPGEELILTVSGSAGLGLSESLDLPFVQEVFAEKIAAQRFCPGTDVIIELGGEDAKILFLTGGFEMRMNGTCAGGTGAFIDQMAALLNTDAGGLNELAQNATTIYPIASRCGVFAKTDVQPLLNEGARKEDIAASIFQSVVTQTISGLACGRPIRGYVAFLGGPLQYLPELRKRFGYRVVKAKWSGKGGANYSITLRIIGHDDIGIVNNITNVLSKEEKVVMRSINIDSHDGLFSGNLVVLIEDTSKLNALIKKLKNIKGVKQITRL